MPISRGITLISDSGATIGTRFAYVIWFTLGSIPGAIPHEARVTTQWNERRAHRLQETGTTLHDSRPY